jgi:hypothetical protein
MKQGVVMFKKNPSYIGREFSISAQGRENFALGTKIRRLSDIQDIFPP